MQLALVDGQLWLLSIDKSRSLSGDPLEYGLTSRRLFGSQSWGSSVSAEAKNS
jgi:hypothetical protein